MKKNIKITIQIEQLVTLEESKCISKLFQVSALGLTGDKKLHIREAVLSWFSQFLFSNNSSNNNSLIVNIDSVNIDSDEIIV